MSQSREALAAGRDRGGADAARDRGACGAASPGVLRELRSWVARSEFGAVTLELRRLAPGTIHTPEADATASATGQLFLYAVRSGRARVHREEQLVSLTAGDAAFLVGLSHEVSSDAACELLTVRVPAELASEAQAGVDADRITSVPATSLLLRPAVAFASRLFESRPADASGFGLYYVERLLQEMVLGILVDATRSAPVSRASDVFTRALAVIQAQCGDAALTAAAVAAEVNISLRQLERVFRRNDTTVGGEVRRARIEQAVSLLGDPAHEVLSVDQIARFVGFSTGSSLARAMGREGYPTPSALRAHRTEVTAIKPTTTSLKPGAPLSA